MGCVLGMQSAIQRGQEQCTTAPAGAPRAATRLGLRPVTSLAAGNVFFSENNSKRCSKARAVRLCSTSVLPLRKRGLARAMPQSRIKVRHQAVDALKSGCCLRSAQTTAPARDICQLAAAFAVKLQMASALVPGTAAAPAMRERCARACWACALLIPTSRACPCCHR